MAREAIPTWFFVLVVVREGDRYLLVEERKHRGGWYLPAGRVEAGETFAEAARRETIEEAGIDPTLTGVLRVEHTPQPSGTRVRVILLAEARGQAPRTIPNEHTLRAGLFTLDELASLTLRGQDAREAIEAVHHGAPAAPMTSLTREGAPW